MKQIDELTEAEFKLQMRQMYHKIGLKESLMCLYAMCQSVQWLIEVIKEENEEAKKFRS